MYSQTEPSCCYLPNHAYSYLNTKPYINMARSLLITPGNHTASVFADIEVGKTFIAYVNLGDEPFTIYFEKYKEFYPTEISPSSSGSYSIASPISIGDILKISCPSRNCSGAIHILPCE